MIKRFLILLAGCAIASVVAPLGAAGGPGVVLALAFGTVVVVAVIGFSLTRVF